MRTHSRWLILSLKLCIIQYVCVCAVVARVFYKHVHVEVRRLAELDLESTAWFLGIKLRSPVLVTGVFTS